MQMEIYDYERNAQAPIFDCYYQKIAIKLTKQTIQTCFWLFFLKHFLNVTSGQSVEYAYD